MKLINLLEYKDSPHLITHRVFGNPVFIYELPGVNCHTMLSNVLVVFESGETRTFYRDYESEYDSDFILRSKPKKKIVGWRKTVLYQDGCFGRPNYRPTKEAFEENFKLFKLIGDWQKEEYEIEED